MNLRLYFSLILLSLTTLHTSGQTNWQFMKGVGYHPAVPLRATLNQEHTLAHPGFRRPVATWTYGGEFYMYGGYGFNDPEGSSTGASNAYYHFNNIWKYNPVSNSWTWIKPGAVSTDPVNYGTVGVESAEVRPKPGREGSGWLVGDYFYLYDGSFWRFNMQTKNWMCIKMVPNAVYSPLYEQLNVPSTTAYPGPRVDACTWVKGNFLYLFGGATNMGNEASNDIWKYNLNTGEWTWIKGGQNNWNEIPGTPGVEDAANRPNTASQILLGVYDDHVFIYNRNDQVWRYNMNTNNWCIKSGTDVVTMSNTPVPFYYDNPRYGMQHVYHASNSPGRRTGSVGWSANGKMYIFGGNTKYHNSVTYWNFDHNEIWEFDTAISQWRYIKGNAAINQYGKYGVQGVESPGNLPGGRSVLMHWKSGNEVFLAGGMGLGANGRRGVQTDLWKYNVTTNNFTWVKGKPNATLSHVALETGTENKFNLPALSNDYANWQTDSFMYLFGVMGKVSDSLPKAGTELSVWYESFFDTRSGDAVWRYNNYTNKWSLVKEESKGYPLALNPEHTDRAAVYGTLNTYGDSLTPGRRDGVATWTLDHKLYLFGGIKVKSDDWSMIDSLKNDLWEFNPATRQWRWIKGPNFNNGVGVYGQQGVFAAQMYPVHVLIHLPGPLTASSTSWVVRAIMKQASSAF